MLPAFLSIILNKIFLYRNSTHINMHHAHSLAWIVCRNTATCIIAIVGDKIRIVNRAVWNNHSPEYFFQVRSVEFF